jgi:hypothetical protein
MSPEKVIPMRQRRSQQTWPCVPRLPATPWNSGWRAITDALGMTNMKEPERVDDGPKLTLVEGTSYVPVTAPILDFAAGEPNYLTIDIGPGTTEHGWIRLYADGRTEFGGAYQPDATAREFWDHVRAVAGWREQK